MYNHFLAHFHILSKISTLSQNTLSKNIRGFILLIFVYFDVNFTHVMKTLVGQVSNFKQKSTVRKQDQYPSSYYWNDHITQKVRSLLIKFWESENRVEQKNDALPPLSFLLSNSLRAHTHTRTHEHSLSLHLMRDACAYACVCLWCAIAALHFMHTTLFASNNVLTRLRLSPHFSIQTRNLALAKIKWNNYKFINKSKIFK